MVDEVVITSPEQLTASPPAGQTTVILYVPVAGTVMDVAVFTRQPIVPTPVDAGLIIACGRGVAVAVASAGSAAAA